MPWVPKVNAVVVNSATPCDRAVVPIIVVQADIPIKRTAEMEAGGHGSAEGNGLPNVHSPADVWSTTLPFAARLS